MHDYVRFHGTTGRYAGSCSGEQLREWAERLRGLGEGAVAVYAYCNNDIGGGDTENAQGLRGLLQNGGL
ncbi:MAG: DUF72 domain-containing protein [Chloroflexi bacterium]|nr:DUF72 domain-containing protein [Chloroflexota bacterium]